MPGAMTGGTGVKRSESLKSNRSDLSHKKVSFNKDVSVKHIPRGAFVDRNGKLIAVMPESADPKVWFASRKAEKLDADDIAREAQEILTQLDQVTCAASPVPFHEHPHAVHRSPSSATTAPRNNMYSHPGTYSKSLPSPHKKNNIESKNNRLKNIVDQNKINKDVSKVKDKGSTSSTEKRRKSLETILESGGHNGYIDFNSLSKTSSLNNVNETSFSDNDILSNHKTPKKVPDRKSPIRDTNKEKEALHFQDVQGNSAVRALVSRFNEESQKRHDTSAEGLVPMVGVTEPSRDNNHNNNQPFSYLRPSNSPPDLTTKACTYNHDQEGVDEVDKDGIGEQLKSPREVVYAQVVVNNKDKPSKTTVHTKVTNTKTTNIKDQKWQERESSINRSYSSTDKKSRTESPERFQSSTYPRPRDRSKSPSKFVEGRVYANTNARAKSPAKVQTRISNDASGRTKIYLTREELRRNTSNVSSQQKHVARVNINGTSSPRKASPAPETPEKRYYYGDRSSLTKSNHRTATKSNSDTSIKTSQQHKKLIKTNSDISNNAYSNTNELTSMRLVKEASARSKPKIVVTSSDDGHKGGYVKEVQSEGEDKKRRKVKITFHDKPSRTDSDIDKLKGFVEYRGNNSDKEEKIRRSRKHFFSAFLEKAPRGPLNFKKKEAKMKVRKRRGSDPVDSDSQMVWSSPGEEMDDVLRYSNSDSGHRAAPKMWFSSEDVGWSERVEDSSLERPTHKSRVPEHNSRSHSLDRRSKSPRVVAHRSPSYLSRMGRYFSETDRESASQFSENEGSRLTRRHRGGSKGELNESDLRRRRGAAASMGELSETDIRHKRRNGEISTEELSENEGQRRRRHKLKRSVSSAAILHQRKPVSSTGSTANSSESENGTTSGNSGRSVYLHAITVANIPPPPNEGGSSVLSKEEILEKPGRQRQSRSVTRSSSVVGPWKPRPKEPLEINYTSNTSNGRPPRPPRRREKTQANATTEQIGEGTNTVRRVHTTKDGARIAGWFRRKKREPSPSTTPQQKQDIRHR